MSAALSANSGAIGREIDFGKESPWTRLASVLRDIWPKKTATHMAAYTGLLTRSCEFFLSRNSVLNGEAVVALLRSEHGRETLEALMDGADPMWWAEYQFLLEEARHAAVEAQLEAKRQELQRRREALREKP